MNQPTRGEKLDQSTHARGWQMHSSEASVFGVGGYAEKTSREDARRKHQVSVKSLPADRWHSKSPSAGGPRREGVLGIIPEDSDREKTR